MEQNYALLKLGWNFLGMPMDDYKILENLVAVH